MAEVERRIEDGVVWLRLNRPERKNAISAEMRESMIAALDEARTDDDQRCVVIVGAGDAFCAGVDLSNSGGASSKKPDLREIRHTISTGMQRLIRTIWELDKPVLAAVNGIAAGGGAQLALACDLVLAGESARFSQIFVKRGLAVDSAGGWLLPRLVGLARAKELVFFGDTLSASEAEQRGLVNRVVPDDELAKHAHDWATRLGRSATRAIGASKRLLNASFQTTLEEFLQAEANEQTMITTTEDFSEGMKAFMEKRDPDFRGR